VAGAAAEPVAAADLFTPPWPLQAPRPPLEELPSLQVTMLGALPVMAVPAAGAAAGAVAGAAAGAGVLLLVVVAGTDLFTPPWPLQAPRPPLEALPSLQVTVVVEASCARTRGAVNSAAASAIPRARDREFVTFICSSPCE
jgi:hypothetical protein